MKLAGNSIIDSVIDFANVKFGVELSAEDVSKQLRNMKFSETLKIVDAIKTDNDEQFSDYIDLSAVSEAYGTVNTRTPSGSSSQNQQSQGMVANRRANIANQDAARDGTSVSRSVAGGNKQPTGTGGGQGGGGGQADPDDIERQQNAAGIQNVQQVVQNQSAEIERLKQLAGAR